MVALAACLGCNRDQPSVTSGKSDSRATPTTRDVEHYSVEQIGETLGGYLQELDGGRLNVAPPKSWHVEPRSAKYVVRYVLDGRHRAVLPRITITGEAADFEKPYDLDEDSLLEFQDLVADSIDDRMKKAIVEPLKPMVLGEVPCVRYVIGKRFLRGNRTIRGKCQIIKTLHAGRIYTVALDAYEGTLVEQRNRAYAVVAGMEFTAPGDDDSESKSGSDTEAPGTDP